MYGKKVKLIIIFFLAIFVTIILTIFLILKSLEENVVYFLSPSEVKKLIEIDNKKIRIGGMVKEGSINTNTKQIKFIITDFKNEVNVSFVGSVPNLFAEGKGVVAEGYLEDRNYFKANKILAKHDENYMPPEVREALEAN